jgi:hypothetical protein
MSTSESLPDRPLQGEWRNLPGLTVGESLDWEVRSLNLNSKTTQNVPRGTLMVLRKWQLSIQQDECCLKS